MGRRSSQNLGEISETGNWNVAQPFVQFKIMRLLYYLDLYEEIATFGTNEIIEELQLPPEVITLNRIRGLKRLAKMLQMLINNTKFAIKDKNDKEIFKEQHDNLLEIIKVIPLVEEKKVNQRDKSVSMDINEEHFNTILALLVDIKTYINEPLNNNDLIFSNTEEFDPEAYKEEFIKEVTTTG